MRQLDIAADIASFKVAEPENCIPVVIKLIDMLAEVCETPKEVTEKYRCGLWVHVRLLLPLLSFGPVRHKIFHVKALNLRFVDIKRGERLYTYVC